MKKAIFISTFLIIFGFVFIPKAEAGAYVGVGVNIGFFYSSLSPHGQWIEMEPGFVVWKPHRINRYWRPYMYGRWVWTNYGWYWLSNEPFGWVTYHYGRWYYDDFYGWIWIPDDVWGPAWVEWRYDDDYIGWAPLPPYATFNISIGIHFTRHWYAPTHYWTFIRYRHFGRVIQYRDIASERDVRRVIGKTRSDHRYRIENERVIHMGVERNIIEQRTRTKVRQVTIEEIRKQPGEKSVLSADKRNIERIQVYRPTREDLQRPAVNPNIRSGERQPSFDVKEITRKRNEQPVQIETRREQEGTRIEQRQQKNEPQIEPNKDQSSKPKTEPQKRVERQRNRTQMQERPETNTQERRKELIQKHEDRTTPHITPERENRRQKIEQRQNEKSASPFNRKVPQRSSERDNQKRTNR